VSIGGSYFQKALKEAFDHWSALTLNFFFVSSTRNATMDVCDSCSERMAEILPLRVTRGMNAVCHFQCCNESLKSYLFWPSPQCFNALPWSQRKMFFKAASFQRVYRP
jgi:hypothetical protein